MIAEPSRGSGRGRPRCEESRTRILAAAVELLETEAWGNITVEAIASKAKVGKQTIYKWWGGRPGLLVDAYLSSLQARVPQPNTGHVEKDLVTFLKRAAHNLRETNAGPTLSALIAEAQGDEDLAEAFRERFVGVRRELLRQILQRGIARGELRPDCDVEVTIDLLFGAFWYRLLVRNAPLDSELAERIVASILPAIGVKQSAARLSSRAASSRKAKA